MRNDDLVANYSHLAYSTTQSEVCSISVSPFPGNSRTLIIILKIKSTFIGSYQHPNEQPPVGNYSTNNATFRSGKFVDKPRWNLKYYLCCSLAKLRASPSAGPMVPPFTSKIVWSNSSGAPSKGDIYSYNKNLELVQMGWFYYYSSKHTTRRKIAH